MIPKIFNVTPKVVQRASFNHFHAMTQETSTVTSLWRQGGSLSPGMQETKEFSATYKESVSLFPSLTLELPAYKQSNMMGSKCCSLMNFQVLRSIKTKWYSLLQTPAILSDSAALPSSKYKMTLKTTILHVFTWSFNTWTWSSCSLVQIWSRCLICLMLSSQRKWLDFEPHWKFWSRILVKTKHIWFKAFKTYQVPN